MRSTADITLIENSTAGNPPKIFRHQTVEIANEAETIARSIDGHIAKGNHPSLVTWLGGTVEALTNITNVKIVASGGAILIEGALNTFRGVPHEVAGGVRFHVMRHE